MASKSKILVRPTSTITVPVGTSVGTVSIASILNACGLADNGTLKSMVESFRIVGGEFRAGGIATNTSAVTTNNASSVKFAGGQTYELMDPYHAVKLKVSDRNPLGYWKNDTSGEAFSTEGWVDVVSFTIAVRYRQVNFQ